MARPPRIEFPGAVCHLTSRGDRREPIFVDDHDRHGFFDVVTLALSRFDAEILAYCPMRNHYHFALRTRKANLSLLMRHIGLTMSALAKELGLSVSRVSRLIARAEETKDKA